MRGKDEDNARELVAVVVTLRLGVWGSSLPSQEAQSVDISEQGALVETDLSVPLGALLDLRIELPEEITGQPSTEWRCKSRVVHLASPVGSAAKVGAHFDWLEVSPR